MAATKIDYVALASAIYEEAFKIRLHHAFDYLGRREALDSLHSIARRMALHFARTNKKFDPDKFYEACGLTPPKGSTL
jgi:hypothetical protein